MGIVGIGIDIVHAPSSVVQRTPARLATRILSSKELREWRCLPRSLLTQPQSPREAWTPAPQDGGGPGLAVESSAKVKLCVSVGRGGGCAVVNVFAEE